MREKSKKDRYAKAVDETVSIPLKQGNGVLRYFACVDKRGGLVRYSFAYINFRLCSFDNGRVVGYDNCHGYHHRHVFGKEEKINFIGYEEIANCFEKEWRMYHEKAKGH